MFQILPNLLRQKNLLFCFEKLVPSKMRQKNITLSSEDYKKEMLVRNLSNLKATPHI